MPQRECCARNGGLRVKKVELALWPIVVVFFATHMHVCLPFGAERDQAICGVLQRPSDAWAFMGGQFVIVLHIVPVASWILFGCGCRGVGGSGWGGWGVVMEGKPSILPLLLKCCVCLMLVHFFTDSLD